MFISFMLLLNPIAQILGFISFVGTIAEIGIMIIAFIVSAILSASIMIIAALINRPVYLVIFLGIIIIACVALSKWTLKLKLKKN